VSYSYFASQSKLELRRLSCAQYRHGWLNLTALPSPLGSIARPRKPLGWLREFSPATIPKFLGACEGERPLPAPSLGGGVAAKPRYSQCARFGRRKVAGNEIGGNSQIYANAEVRLRT